MALDKDTGNTLFGNIKKNENQQQEQPKITSEIKEATKDHKDNPKAKWEQFDKVTSLLTTDQKEGLDRVAKKLMKYRSKDLKGNENKERITANTLMRALIENFLDMEEAMQLEVLSSENEVHKWVSNAFKKNI